MITCVLMGGLGNQLFQIFTTISYALNYVVEYNFLNTTTLGGNGNTLRYTFWNNIFRKLQHVLINKYPDGMVLIREPHFQYTDLSFSGLMNSQNICIYGYFQSYKYFDSNYYTIYNLLNIVELNREVLKKLEKNPDRYSFTQNDLSKSISMHFRLGDYKKLTHYHPIMSCDYYIKSLKYILEKDTLKTVLYFCEEEDIQTVEETVEKCKYQFPNVKFIRVSNDFADWEQLLLMSHCKHHIIANSSFSWWGAYIGFKTNHRNKIICYPSLWFSHNVNTDDLFPPKWIRINCSNKN